MLSAMTNSKQAQLRKIAGLLLVIAVVVFGSVAMYAGDKKNKKKDDKSTQTQKEQVPLLKQLDYSKIVWPNPPAPTRVKYLDFFANEKYHPDTQTQASKGSWMDRLAGATPDAQKRIDKPLFALWTPYGMAVDKSGKHVYVADGRVGAVFIFDIATREAELIKSGASGVRFGFIVGLALDDNDRLFVSDSQKHRIMVFTPDHKFETAFAEGMVNPGGMAIDTENRFLYVADAELDQILVYDADSFKLLRKMGTCCKDHALIEPGEFSKPTNVAVDEDGNLYVTDTWNDRVEVFDPDGKFIRTFGKNGDGPGRFARPKGIAIDSDGHIWVADAVQNRLQCFTPDGQLLLYMGGPGQLPGQFTALAGLYIDKQNRIFTSEQDPGRVQMFQYFTNEQAKAELEKREEAKKAGSSKPGTKDTKTQDATPSTTPEKPGNAEQPKSTAPEKKPS